MSTDMILIKGVDVNDALIKLISLIPNLKQITDSHELCCWTDGDWYEYWYLFEGDNDIRVSFVDCKNETFVSVITEAETLECGKKFWSGPSLTFEMEHMTADELVKYLDKFGITFTDKDFKYGLITNA